MFTGIIEAIGKVREPETLGAGRLVERYRSGRVHCGQRCMYDRG